MSTFLFLLTIDFVVYFSLGNILVHFLNKWRNTCKAFQRWNALPGLAKKARIWCERSFVLCLLNLGLSNTSTFDRSLKTIVTSGWSYYAYLFPLSIALKLLFNSQPTLDTNQMAITLLKMEQSFNLKLYLNYSVVYALSWYVALSAKFSTDFLVMNSASIGFNLERTTPKMSENSSFF